MSLDEIIKRLDDDERALLLAVDPSGHLAAYMPTLRGAFGLAGWGLMVRKGAGTDTEMWVLTDSGKCVRRELEGRKT